MSGSKTSESSNKSNPRPVWNHVPDGPMYMSPILSWPPEPLKLLKWFADSWFIISERMFYVVLAIIAWVYILPTLPQMQTFEAGWIFQLFLFNLIALSVYASSLHMYFYAYTKQGKKLKFDHREMAKNNGTYSFRNQVLDNIFWAIASGVTLWTLFNAVIFWMYANAMIPIITWDTNPLWFVLIFYLIPLFESLHFYWIHRLLHWPPLYKIAHALHHRNINVGPWSGLSMHPIEHALYFSSIFIHLIVPSHPIHVVFHFLWLTLGAISSHTGFEGLLVKDKKRITLGTFYHQLHHRYFECNYGNGELPLDKWFGSFHDGSPEATETVKERRRQMYASK